MKPSSVCTSFARIRTAQILLAVLALAGSSCLGQSFAAPPPPPGSLPPLLAECETGANYNTCGSWVWDGSAYNAFWSNRAAGRITVSSAGPSQLQMQRTDAGGASAGLTAAYTAKWDGKTFSDGKLDFSFRGATGTFNWTAAAAATPVYPTPLQDYSYTNWYPAPLTGYARFHGSSPVGSVYIGTGIDDYRLRGESPMSPGDARTFTLRVIPEPANYIKGANYPQDSIIAAIYADGTTFGDPNVLASMVRRRRSLLDALTSAGNAMCTLDHPLTSIADLESALNRQHDQEDAHSPAGKPDRDTAYGIVIKSLDGGTRSHLTADQAVAKTFDQLNQRRTGLADPIKDKSGQLLIPPPAPLACNLP